MLAGLVRIVTKKSNLTQNGKIISRKDSKASRKSQRKAKAFGFKRPGLKGFLCALCDFARDAFWFRPVGVRFMQQRAY
jgi:hypothetical protein